MTRPKATVTVKPVPPRPELADHHIPAGAPYEAVVTLPNGRVVYAHPLEPSERVLHPAMFAVDAGRAVCKQVGGGLAARYVAPGSWLTFDTDAAGYWVLVDSRRCRACGEIKGVPMCCNDPITKREMIALGPNAPFVKRSPLAAVAS